MRRCNGVRVFLSLAALSVLALAGAPRAAGAQPPACGPGAPWVDTCPAGTDLLASRATATIEFLGGPTLALTLIGPTTVWRGPGTPHTIPTEIVSLALRGGGVTITAGDGNGNGVCDGPLCSLGAITEVPGNPFLATSFFDVFFEVSGAGPFGTLHTYSTHQTSNGEDPCRMEATIPFVPPPAGTTYICQNPAEVLLYDANDVLRARLINETHEILPEPGSVLLLGSGLAGVAAVAARRRRRSV